MNVLLARTDRIGDLILSTPAIATVRRSFPDAHITMVTSAYNRIVVERNADIDELVSLPRAIRPERFGAQFRNVDLAIAFAPRFEDLRIVGATGATVRVGYTYARRYLARLTARLFVNRIAISEADPELCERDPGRAVRHEVEQLLDLVALAGARDRVLDLRLDLRDEDRAAVASLPERPIVLHLAPRWFQGGSTLASTVEVARRLTGLGRPLVITANAEIGDAIDAFAGVGAAAVLRDLPFFHWAAVFERSACVVTVDTGATHVASAMRRPTLVAFEHRYFRLASQEWAPYRVPSRSLRKPQSDDEASLARFRDEVALGVADLIDA
uniref:Uncharacterized protein n=1 Tax=mine drainage metagenome TaxID=410659 RepID=E6Q7C9_9ZZZZ